MGNSVPGGWFDGRAASREEEEPVAAAIEPKQLRPQAATAATNTAQPAGELKRSGSLIEFYSCESSASRKQESTELPTSRTGVNTDSMGNKRGRRSDNPRKLPYELIKLITKDFSEELGRGAFGKVFKGVLEDGEEVAVKMLRFMAHISDKQFENEFEILKRLKHPNIVRLLGYCDDTEDELVKYNGELIVCKRIHRALCLEYMPNGSLGKLLTAENLHKDWPTRYKIIKGICEGLNYLQEGLEFPIFHLDLKPDNILLNESMMPKISDFGLSRLIGGENTKTTLTPLGTIGYLPPEFINYNVISKEYDIYSLGVIVTKIITGTTGYSHVADMGAHEFVEQVHENWKTYLQEIPMYASLEVDCKQVKKCIEIARRCMETDRHQRPAIKDIVRQLNEVLPLPEVSMARLSSRAAHHNEGQSGPMEKKCGNLYKDGASEISHPAHPWACFDAALAWERPPGMRIRPQAIEIGRRLGAMRGPGSFPTLQSKQALSVPEPLSMDELMLGSSHKDPPMETCHPVHPEQNLKLMTDTGVPFMCDGCKEPGYGPRYACDSLDLHTRCALADDPLFGLHTLVLPLFGYGKQFEFRFLHEAPFWVVARICGACGEATTGFVYYCSEQDLVLHPCCASLPDRIIHDGRAFDLHRRASRSCSLCPDNEGRRGWFWANVPRLRGRRDCRPARGVPQGNSSPQLGEQRRWFWAYRSYMDGDEVPVDLHVACLKETARRSWETETYYRKQDSAGGALNVDDMLDNMFSSSIAGTVASFVTALVLGNLIVKM